MKIYWASRIERTWLRRLALLSLLPFMVVFNTAVGLVNAAIVIVFAIPVLVWDNNRNMVAALRERWSAPLKDTP